MQSCGVRPSVCLSVNILRKSLLLPEKWLDRHQTCTRWSPEVPASRMCSRSRSRSKVMWYGHFCYFTKIAFLAGKWLDRHQTCTRWSPDGPASSEGVLKVKVKVNRHSSHGETVCQTVCYTVRSHVLSLHALTLWNTITLFFFRPGACRGRSRCHKLSPWCSVLCTSFGWRQAKVHWLQVGLHRSQPGLSGSAGPPSPLHRRAHDASLKGAVMILPRVGAAVEVTIERETTSTDSIWQEWLPSTKTDLIIGNQFGPVDIQDTSKAPIIQSVNLLDKVAVTDHVSAPYRKIGRMHVL